MSETSVSGGSGPAQNPRTQRIAALVSAFVVFGVMGLTGAMATTLVPAVRIIFGVSLSAAIAVQWIALVVSGLASLPMAHALQRQGPARVIMAGLALALLGCAVVRLAIVPPVTASEPFSPSFAALLAALAMVALGNTALQVAANLLVVDLGERSGAPVRLTLAQAFNALGVLAGVHLGAWAMLGQAPLPGMAPGMADRVAAMGAARVYLWCAGFNFAALAMVAICRKAMARGAPSAPPPAPAAPIRSALIRRALASRWALAGAGAIALYVGAEGAVGSILISFLHQDSVAGLSLSAAGATVANLFWGGALAGRFAGSWLMAGRSAPRFLAAAAMLAALACMLALLGSGHVAATAALSIGLLNAIMFPVIFTITIERAAAPPEAVSGLLITAIGGGVLIPVGVGWVGDLYGLSRAFAVPLCAYLIIALFAIFAEVLPRADQPPQDSRITSSVGKRSDLI